MSRNAEKKGLRVTELRSGVRGAIAQGCPHWSIAHSTNYNDSVLAQNCVESTNNYVFNMQSQQHVATTPHQNQSVNSAGGSRSALASDLGLHPVDVRNEPSITTSVLTRATHDTDSDTGVFSRAVRNVHSQGVLIHSRGLPANALVARLEGRNYSVDDSACNSHAPPSNVHLKRGAMGRISCWQ